MNLTILVRREQSKETKKTASAPFIAFQSKETHNVNQQPSWAVLGASTGKAVATPQVLTFSALRFQDFPVFPFPGFGLS